MTNAYITAIDARVNENKLSASNVSRLKSVCKTLADARVLKLLESAKVSTDFAQQNVYAILKLENLLSNAVKLHKLNDMNKYVLLTAIKCDAASETITVTDCKNACSKSRVVADDRRALTVQNVKHVDEKTVNAQYNSTLNALKALNILKSVARESKETHFAIDAKNAIFKALQKQIAA
jgi:hypothetical protein